MNHHVGINSHLCQGLSADEKGKNGSSLGDGLNESEPSNAIKWKHARRQVVTLSSAVSKAGTLFRRLIRT